MLTRAPLRARRLRVWTSSRSTRRQSRRRATSVRPQRRRSAPMPERTPENYSGLRKFPSQFAQPYPSNSHTPAHPPPLFSYSQLARVYRRLPASSPPPHLQYTLFAHLLPAPIAPSSCCESSDTAASMCTPTPLRRTHTHAFAHTHALTPTHSHAHTLARHSHTHASASAAVPLRADYESVIKLADGFNAADLRNVCTEAGMYAIRAERDYVIEEDFMKGVRKVAENKKLEGKLDYNKV
eukprot:6178186-Pleurochrysis_carterae.AAC.4